MSSLPPMPADWADQGGWQTYYAALYPAGAWQTVRGWCEETTAMVGPHIASLMKWLQQQGRTRVWFPGCGLDPLPKLFSEFGFTVHATDISPSVVRFQQCTDNNIAKLQARYLQLGLTQTAAPFTCAIHDFRDPCSEGPFDLLMNFKSVQGFSGDTLKRIAEAHFASLRPGCSAYFDTMNVQGDRRDVLEQALADAGFHVPAHAANAWLRRSLRETGIPHVFILGRPIIPRHGVYATDEEKAQRDTATLHAIFAEYQQRVAAERTQVDPQARTAVVIYNTG